MTTMAERTGHTFPPNVPLWAERFVVETSTANPSRAPRHPPIAPSRPSPEGELVTTQRATGTGLAPALSHAPAPRPGAPAGRPLAGVPSAGGPALSSGYTPPRVSRDGKPNTYGPAIVPRAASWRPAPAIDELRLEAHDLADLLVFVFACFGTVAGLAAAAGLFR